MKRHKEREEDGYVLLLEVSHSFPCSICIFIEKTLFFAQTAFNFLTESLIHGWSDDRKASNIHNVVQFSQKLGFEISIIDIEKVCLSFLDYPFKALSISNSPLSVKAMSVNTAAVHKLWN